MDETFTFFSKKKLYKYKNNKLYQNNRKLGGDIVDIGKKCEGAMKECIHDPQNKEVVGVGGFGKVSKFTCGKENFVMKRSDNENKDIVHNEITILMKLNVPSGHRNIIEYMCSYENLSDNYIILPCAQTDLRLFLSEEKDTLLVIEQYAIMDNLLKGMNYMHHKNIIHNDIKDENILIMPDFSIKYCDFGLSFVVKNDSKVEQINKVLYQGTKEYITPESFTFDGYQSNYELFKVDYHNFVDEYQIYAKDYWCLGNVFYHILNKNDTFAYTIGNLLNGKFENSRVPEWLKISLLNFNDVERKTPQDFTEDMIKNDVTLNVETNNASTQSGGLEDQRTRRRQNQEKSTAMKLHETPSEKIERITKNMKSVSKDIKMNQTLYGNQPILEKPRGVKSRFTIEN